MKIEEMLSGLSPQEKIDRLSELAVKKEKTTYSRSLTPEELSASEKDFARKSLERERLKAEAKEAADSYKTRVSTLDDELKTMLDQIDNKKRQVPGILYFIPNHIEGKMLMVESGGEVIDERELKPEERQGNILDNSMNEKAPEFVDENQENFEETTEGTKIEVSPLLETEENSEVVIEKTKRTRKKAEKQEVASSSIETNGLGQESGQESTETQVSETEEEVKPEKKKRNRASRSKKETDQSEENNPEKLEVE